MKRTIELLCMLALVRASAGGVATGDAAAAKFPAGLRGMGLHDAKWMQLTNGVEYYYGRFSDLLGTLDGYAGSRNDLHLLRIDYARAPVRMKFVDHTQEPAGKRTTSETAAAHGALFAINMTMEDGRGRPQGYVKADGAVIPNGAASTGVKDGFAFDGGKAYRFDRDWTAADPATGAPKADAWANVVAHEAYTLHGGVPTWGPEATYFSRANYTFLGTTADGVLWAGAVDGRRKGVSDGLGYHEVAALQRELGCVEGVCCDGGGSTTMAIRKDLMAASGICDTQRTSAGSNDYWTMNYLSDGSERKVVNQLLFVPATEGFFDDVKIPMRDGVHLAGDLYIPTNRAEKVGCLLSFSPYDATGAGKPWSPERAEAWGVATLAVDCRGRCHSEGVFEPWEGRLVDDADDLLSWIAAQPWSNGRVVMVGGSYPGNTQLACLRSANPALVACAPSVITFNPHSIHYAPGGVLIPQFFQGWHSSLASPESWKEFTRHPDRDDPYWTERCDLRNLAAAKGRAFYQAGWFDMLGLETFESFALLPEGSFLRVGPWSHGVNTFDKPDIDYSKVAGAAVTEDEEVEFLRSALEGRPSETAKLPGKMQIFVMGANVWRYENEWPLARTVYRKLFFDEGFGLSFDAPKGGAGEDAFVYDPENPVPTRGGRIIHAGGQYSQAEIEARGDVLSYTTATLAEDLEVTGKVTASLVAKSTAKVADVAVKLVDVYPDGTPYNVLDSICRGSFAGDAPTKLDFRVDVTSYVFKKGHRVRVEIAGSNSPHYEKAPDPATTRLVRGESHLVLPTIPSENR